MNVDDAAHATVHDHPGGSETLAVRLGMSGALLRNKVNTNNDRNVLTLGEAVRITGLTGDHRMLHAWAGQLDCAVVPLSTSEAGNIVNTLLEQNEHEGNFARVLRMAMADSVITPNEMRAIEKAGGDLQGVLLKLLRQLQGLQAVAP